MRVRLVEPRPPGRTVYDFAKLPRLGLPLIGALLGKQGHEVRVYCELLSPVDLGDCLEADLVGISTTTSTAPLAYRFADLLSELGVPVMLGGPHVTFCPDEALAHAPFVVRGEGQATAVELVRCLEAGAAPGDLARVRGLSYRLRGGEPCHNPDRPITSQEEFRLLPSPDLNLVAGHETMTTKPVMTQWGCPHNCEFCSVTSMFSRSVRHREHAAVVAELRALAAERVFFYDDNFVVSKRRTATLLQAMVSSGVTPTWFAQVRADAVLRSRRGGEVDDEFLSLMHRAGGRMVMIGFEAITDAGLAQVGKQLSADTASRAVEAFHRHGLAVHGMFIAGLDTDGPGGARATAEFARRVGTDTFQLMAETPLPGTVLWRRAVAEGRLLSSDWSLFDGHQVVMQPALTSALELQLGIMEATRYFYSWPRTALSAAGAVLAHIPALVGAARPSLLASVPALARLARARRWEDVGPLLRTRVPPAARQRLAGALWLPAARAYARMQLDAWWGAQRSRDHLQLLRSLTGAAAPIS